MSSNEISQNFPTLAQIKQRAIEKRISLDIGKNSVSGDNHATLKSPRSFTGVKSPEFESPILSKLATSPNFKENAVSPPSLLDGNTELLDLDFRSNKNPPLQHLTASRPKAPNKQSRIKSKAPEYLSNEEPQSKGVHLSEEKNSKASANDSKLSKTTNGNNGNDLKKSYLVLLPKPVISDVKNVSELRSSLRSIHQSTQDHSQHQQKAVPVLVNDTKTYNNTEKKERIDITSKQDISKQELNSNLKENQMKEEDLKMVDSTGKVKISADGYSGKRSIISDLLSIFENGRGSDSSSRKTTSQTKKILNFTTQTKSATELSSTVISESNGKRNDGGKLGYPMEFRQNLKNSEDKLSDSTKPLSSSKTSIATDFASIKSNLRATVSSTSKDQQVYQSSQEASSGLKSLKKSNFSSSNTSLQTSKSSLTKSNISLSQKKEAQEMSTDYAELKIKLKSTGGAALWNAENQEIKPTVAPDIKQNVSSPSKTAVSKSVSQKTDLAVKVRTSDTSNVLMKSDKEKATMYENLEADLKSTSNTVTLPVFDTKLKALKSDVFFSKSGGATRPKGPILWVLKGKKRHVAKKASLSFNALNLSDPFIMDIPPIEVEQTPKDGFVDPEEKNLYRLLFVFTGDKVLKVRRSRAVEIANLMKDLDYSGKANIFLIEVENLKSKSILEKELPFWNALLGKTGTRTEIMENLNKVKTSDVVMEADYEKNELEEAVMLTEFPSNVMIAKSAKDLKYQLLKSSNSYVLDCKSEIFVWAGKLSSEKTKQSALSVAQVLSSTRKVELFLEGETFERIAFRLKFEDWPYGKELAVYNVLEVKQATNVKAKDKEWKVYDRGSDARKIYQIDIAKMYDKMASPEYAITKNTEMLDIDPAELIHRDWGFVSLRAWAVYNENSSSTKVDLTLDAIEKMERKISASNPFVFYSKECYVFMYEYKERPPNMADEVLAERAKITKEELYNQMKDCVLLYLWSGADSSVSDQGIMAHAALEIEKQIKPKRASPNIKARHIRIQEHKEPKHFLNVISGGNVPPNQPQKVYDLLTKNMDPPSIGHVVRRGAYKSFEGNSSALYHILGITKETVHVSQLQIDPNLISSAHCYVFSTGKEILIKIGVGSFEWEQQMAKRFSENLLSKETGGKVTILSGNENIRFFKALGKDGLPMDETFWSKRPQLSVLYEKNLMLNSTQGSKSKTPYDVRLWRVNYFLNGNPTASEISPFSSEDLDENGTFILDAYFKIYVWIGAAVARNKFKSSNEPEMLKKVPEEKFAGKGPSQSFKEMALAIETASNYADFIFEREDNRLSKSDVFIVQSSKEDTTFKSQFPFWGARASDELDDWPSNITLENALNCINGKTYSIEELKKWAQTRKDMPFGLDVERLETYLRSEDFERVFSMTQQKFYEMPQWKQLDLKKKTGMF